MPSVQRRRRRDDGDTGRPGRDAAGTGTGDGGSVDATQHSDELRHRRPVDVTLQQYVSLPVAPPGFCNRGGSEVWVYRGSRVRSPPVPVVLSVYQRGSLLDGLAMHLSRDTKKFHDNESTHIT